MHVSLLEIRDMRAETTHMSNMNANHDNRDEMEQIMVLFHMEESKSCKDACLYVRAKMITYSVIQFHFSGRKKAYDSKDRGLS